MAIHVPQTSLCTQYVTHNTAYMDLPMRSFWSTLSRPFGVLNVFSISFSSVFGVVLQTENTVRVYKKDLHMKFAFSISCIPLYLVSSSVASSLQLMRGSYTKASNTAITLHSKTCEHPPAPVHQLPSPQYRACEKMADTWKYAPRMRFFARRFLSTKNRTVSRNCRYFHQILYTVQYRSYTCLLYHRVRTSLYFRAVRA